MQALKQDGYSTCFFVGGGNSMHLLESASRLFECVPVVHEVTAAMLLNISTNLQREKIEHSY